MHHERESQTFHILSLPHTMTLSDAGKACLDGRCLQHGKDGSGADGDDHQVLAVAHERSSTLESSNWSGWLGNCGAVGGGDGRLAGRSDLLDLAVGDLLDGRSDGGETGRRDLLNLTVGDLLDGRRNDGRSGSDLLDLAIGDLLDGGSHGDGCRSRSGLLDLAIGDLLDHGNRSHHRCGLLDLTIANLSGEGRGNKGQSEDDLLDGRHC